MPLPALDTKRLIIVLGKGGVGRTTIAMALATQLAARGRRTLFYQANAKDRLSALLGGPPASEEIRSVRPNLWAVNTNPQAALHEYGLMVLRYEAVYRMVLENRVSRALVRAIPGLDDYAVLGKLWFHTTEELRGQPRFDTIVFDAPATGHAVTMLRIPHSILDAVPEGPLTRDALKVRALIEDPARTAPILVTLAEEMPTNETIELAAQLAHGSGIHAAALIVNQVYPDHFPAGTTAARVLTALLADPAASEDPVVARARMSAARRTLNERYLERLRRELPLPTTMVPKIFVAQLGPREVEQIATQLAGEAATRR